MLKPIGGVRPKPLSRAAAFVARTPSVARDVVLTYIVISLPVNDGEREWVFSAFYVASDLISAGDIIPVWLVVLVSLGSSRLHRIQINREESQNVSFIYYTRPCDSTRRSDTALCFYWCKSRPASGPYSCSCVVEHATGPAGKHRGCLNETRLTARILMVSNIVEISA